MPHGINSGFYIPRDKAGIIKMIKPSWNGKKSILYEMSKKRLIAILHTIRRKQMENLMSGKPRFKISETDLK